MRSSQTRDEVADRLIDVFLESELGGVKPPDLTDQILARLAHYQPEPSNAALNEHAPFMVKRPAKPQASPWLARLAIAATLLLITSAGAYWSIVHSSSTTSNPNQVANGTAKPSIVEPKHRVESPDLRPDAADRTNADRSHDVAPKPNETNQPQPATVIAKDKPVRERMSSEQLPRPELVNNQASSDDIPSDSGAATSQRPKALNEAEIVAAIDREFQALWKSAGFAAKGKDKEAEATQNKADWRARMVALVPATQQAALSSTSVNPLDFVRQNPSIWAEQWLAQLFSSDALKRLDDTSRAQIVDRVSRVFRGEEGWDHAVRAMLNVQQSVVAKDNESATIPRDSLSPDSLLLVALQSPRGVDLVDRLGPTILDEDLVCSRCHDHPLKGTMSQRDYWGLAAIFQTEVQWRQDHEVNYITTSKEQPPARLFFETLDGRSRLATPMLPSRLSANSERQADRESVVDGVIASGTLARATVNQLWELAYGRPLVGSVADPDAPPEDAHLNRVRDLLAEQLAAHDFDLGQALTWIVHSAPFRKANNDEGRTTVLTAAERDLADRRERWFYDYRGGLSTEPPQVLLAMAKRLNTPVGERTDGTVLAQAAPGNSPRNGERASSEERRDEMLRRAFPVNRKEVPALWLRSLSNYEEQARHLFYVAGVSRPSERQLQWAAELRVSARDDSTALHQLWWLLQHRS